MQKLWEILPAFGYTWNLKQGWEFYIRDCIRNNKLEWGFGFKSSENKEFWESDLKLSRNCLILDEQILPKNQKQENLLKKNDLILFVNTFIND